MTNKENLFTEEVVTRLEKEFPEQFPKLCTISNGKFTSLTHMKVCYQIDKELLQKERERIFT